MHDLEYAYVKVEPLEWTPEMVDALKAELDYGLRVFSSRKWVPDSSSRGGHWVECKPVEVSNGNKS